jgi:hypothetical protein
MSLENDIEIKKILTKVKALPISVKYSLTIELSSELDVFKCAQSLMDTLCFYRYLNFEYNYMKIDAVILLPNDTPVEFPREINLTSDSKIKLTCDFEVRTHYPSFRKPRQISNGSKSNVNDTWSNSYVYDDKVNKNESIIESPKKTKWYLNILKLRGGNSTNND